MNALLAYFGTNAFELGCAALTLFSVWLTARENIWCWPTGIVAAALYGVFFVRIKLYADASLQLFFIATSFYGWWWWLRGGHNRTEAPVSRLKRRDALFLAALTAIAIGVIGYFFAAHTDAHLPFWDATASGASVTAQLLLMRKKIENWPLWLAIDTLCVGIYVYKGAFPTAVLYALLLILAVVGWIEWNKSWTQQNPKTKPISL